MADVEEIPLFDSEMFERMKREWVLRPTHSSPERRRWCGLKKRVLWTVGFVSIVILTTVLAKTLPRHHAKQHEQPQYEKYMDTLKNGLMFFNA